MGHRGRDSLSYIDDLISHELYDYNTLGEPVKRRSVIFIVIGLILFTGFVVLREFFQQPAKPLLSETFRAETVRKYFPDGAGLRESAKDQYLRWLQLSTAAPDTSLSAAHKANMFRVMSGEPVTEASIARAFQGDPASVYSFSVFVAKQKSLGAVPEFASNGLPAPLGTNVFETRAIRPESSAVPPNAIDTLETNAPDGEMPSTPPNTDFRAFLKPSESFAEECTTCPAQTPVAVPQTVVEALTVTPVPEPPKVEVQVLVPHEYSPLQTIVSFVIVLCGLVLSTLGIFFFENIVLVFVGASVFGMGVFSFVWE